MTASQQLAFDLPHRPAHGRDDFLVAPCNADAVAWIDRWPDWPGTALCLYGPAGSGKSHLLQVWRERSGAVECAARDLSPAAAEQFIGRAAVAIDDADRVDDETALFHLYNLLREVGGHLLLTASAPPGRWPIRLPDLLSRLKAAPAVGIAVPDDVLLSALLAKLFADRQLRVPADVLAYAVLRMERSFEAARHLVAAVDAAALSEKRAVTLPLVRAILAEGRVED